jgi:hypothetical protein
MYGIIPKRINKNKIEQTSFVDLESDILMNRYQDKSNEKCCDELFELTQSSLEDENKQIEHSESDKKEFYEINYKLFISKKSLYIDLIEKFLGRTDLNLNEVEPDISYITNKYKTYNSNEFIKTKQYSYQGYTEIQCEALTNKGIQCSRKTETYETNYCGIHKKKQANGTIHTGYLKK